MAEHAEFIRSRAALADIVLDGTDARPDRSGVAIVDRNSIVDRISIMARAK
jgi:hypothetical protein